jgi:hypothetical protein
MEECSICLESETNVTLLCNHTFHKKCIDEWLNKKNNCPICRHNITYNNPIDTIIKIINDFQYEEYITEFVNSFFN